MHIAVVGSRTLKGKQVYDIIASFFHTFGPETSTIVTGGAEGVDQTAESFAKINGFGLLVFKPDRSQGRHAGFLRNKTIVENSDYVLAIWDGQSKGTKHTIETANRLGKQVKVVKPGEDLW